MPSTSRDETINYNEEEGIWRNFYQGLTQSFIIIFLAEIGDRTFIMVTLLTSQMNKMTLFLIASFGMSLMHIISVLIGAFASFIIPSVFV